MTTIYNVQSLNESNNTWDDLGNVGKGDIFNTVKKDLERTGLYYTDWEIQGMISEQKYYKITEIKGGF